MMNPEIENCLKNLLNRPTDTQVLNALSSLVSAQNPPPDEVLGALERSIEQHQARGQWEAVIGLINLELPSISDDARKANLLAQKGKVLLEELLDQDAALSALKQVLELQPQDEDTRELLEEIELIQGSWQKVVAKYADEADSASDRQVATTLFLSAAEVAWRNSPGSDEVEQYLKRSLEIEARNSKASRHLERLLQQGERWEELAELLRQRSDVATSREERLDAILKRGAVYSLRLDNLDEAVTCFKSVLGMDSNHGEAMRNLVEVLTRKEDWTALIRVYEDTLRAKPLQDVEAGILIQIGLVYDQKLMQADKAEEHFRRVRKFSPTQPIMLDFYRRFYRDKAEPNKLLALLDAAQRVESDQQKRIDLAKEMASIAEEEVGNLDKAIDIWKGIQRLDSSVTDANSALKRLYRSSSPPKWNALRELLKDELENLAEDQVEQKIQLLMEVVEIYRDNLKLDVMVINTYNAILELQSDHPDALAALSDKYEAMGRWNDLIGLLLRQKDAAEQAADKIDILHRVAALWVEKFGNQSQAIKPLEEILTLDPVEPQALERLREIHGKRRNWRELMDLSRKEAAHRKGAEARRLYKEIAELAAKKLGDNREGIQVWNQVLEQDPNDAEALTELANLYQREKRWPALAEVLHRQVEQADDAARTLELLTALGEIYTRHLDDSAVDGAIEVWKRVLELEPESTKANNVLRDLFVKQQRWSDLEQLFESRAEIRELAETLTAAADKSDDAALKTQLYTNVGQIYRDRLSNPDQAIKVYERVLAIDPSNVDVAQALSPLYQDGAKWARLLDTYEILLNNTEPRHEQLTLLAEIRRLCEENLESTKMAFSWAARAFALDAQNPDLWAELERLADDAGEWEELVTLYTDKVGEIEQAEPRTALLRKLATFSEQKLSRPEDAEVFYRDLLEVQPEDQQALQALERIYDEGQRWGELVEIHHRRVDLDQTTEAKVARLFRVAEIQELEVGDPEAAIAALRSITELDSTNLEAVKSLARLFVIEEQWAELVQALGRELELVDATDDRVSVLFRLGEIHQSELEVHDKSIEYFAQVLALDATHRDAVSALKPYLDPDGDHRGEVARLLQPYYETAEDWPMLVLVQGILLESEQDDQQRIGLLKRRMHLQSVRTDEHEDAFDSGAQLLALNPDDSGTRQDLSQLADALSREEELAQLLARVLDSQEEGANPALELALNWELAVLLDDRLSRAEEAEPRLYKVVELDPTHRDGFDTLERILRDSGKWAELRDLLVQRKDLEHDAESKRDILLQVCSLNEDFLDDAPAAIEAYEEVLELVPDHGVAHKALERHYTELEQWPQLLDLLRREMAYVQDDQGLNELKFRQSELLARHLDDATGATDLLEDVVNVDPTLDRAVELLESLMEQDALRRRITEVLEGVYQRREEWSELVRVLLTRRELASDNFEAVELLCRAAGLQEEQLEAKEAAFNSYREAIALEPGASNIHDAVERLSSELEAWPEAAETWQTAFDAAHEGDVALRARLQMRLAVVVDEKLLDEDRAREAYELLLELDPSDLETAQPAAIALSRLYEQGGMWEQLIAVLRRRLGWAEGAEARAELMIKICRIQEEVLGDIEAAVKTYQELLWENPNSAEALDSLERLYLQTEQWKELVDIYRRRVDLCEAKEDRRSLWVRIAGLQEEELHDNDQAISAYLTVLDEIPDDLDCVRALARIYKQGERWPDLLEMLERELSLEQADEDQRVALIFQIASLHHRYLDDLNVAVERYQQVLGADPHHDGARSALEELLTDEDQKLAAAELLAPVYRRDENWERLIGIYELQAEDAEVHEKVRLLCDVAQLCEEGLDDLDRAFDAFKRVLQVATSEGDFLDHLRQFHRVASTQERWGEFVDVLEQVVVDVLDGDAQKTVHLSAAEVCRDHLDDMPRAREHFQSVLDADPEHVGALQALDALYELLEQWQPLLEILQRQAELEADANLRRTFLMRSAALCRDQLEAPDDSIANYERVLEMFPEHDETIAALDSLYAITRRWPDLADLLERQLGFTEDSAPRVELFFRLGQIRATKLEIPAQALEAYQEVLNLDTSHTEAVESLEGYLDDLDLRVDAALILEPLYKGQQEWQQLIRIYQIRLDATDDPDLTLTLLTRIAQLYEDQIEDLEGAFTWYGKVFLADPADKRIREHLQRLAGILDCWQQLAAVFAEYLDQTLTEDETSRDVAILLGNIYDERLDTVEQATACYRRALDADKADEEAFRLLEHLLTRHELWEDLLALYKEMADATLETEPRRTLLLKICRVWEEALFNLPEAIEAYRAVLDLKEDDDEALSSLDRLYTETERWQDLTELLNRQCDFVEGEDEIVEIKHRVGAIYEMELEDLGTSVDYYEEVLARNSNHSEAIAALERLVMDRDQRFRISQILEQIYKDQDEWAKLVVIYDAQLEFIEQKDRRVTLLREIAQLHEERGGSLELAFKALCRAFEEEFGDPDLLEGIERLASRLNNWPELVNVLSAGVAEVFEMDLQARIHAKIATLQEERLGDRAAAVDSWRKVLEARDTDDRAINALIRLLEALDRNEELIEVLQRKSELSTDVDEQKSTFLRIAEIYETLLVQPEKATETYRQMLLIDEEDMVALNALERLYLMASNWLELIWVYNRKIEFSLDETERRSLQQSVASVYEDKLEDNFEAITAYKTLLEETPDDEGILEALDRLFTKEALFSDLLEVLEAKIRLEGDQQRRIELLFRAGTILEHEIGDLDGCIERYRNVLEEEPTHGESRQALERLVRGDSHREVVAEILERLYGVTGEVKPLVEVLELRLENMADPPSRRDLLLRIGQLYEEGLDDANGAFSAYSRALAEDPSDEQVQAELDRLGGVLSAVPELVQVYEDQLENIYDATLSRSLNLKVAQLLEDILGEDGRAEEHYRAALEFEGDELGPLRALDRILLRQEKWSALLDVLDRELAAVADPAEQAEIYYRMGEIRMSLQEHPDADGAFTALRNALERDPEMDRARVAIELLLDEDAYKVAVLDVLEPIYESAGDFAKLVELLEIRLTTVVEQDERVSLLDRIATTAEHELDDKTAALGALGRAMAVDPGNVDVLDRVDQLAEDLGRYEQLVALGDEVMEGELTAEDARALGLRVAQWYSKKLNDIGKAESSLKKVLDVDPECGEALKELEHIYRASAEFTELSDVLSRRAENELDLDAKRTLLAEVAHINLDNLENATGAILAWTGVLEFAADDREALEMLSGLYEMEEQWEDYIGVQQQLVTMAEPDDQITLKHRVGEVLVQKLEDLARAIDVYQDILDLDPQDPEALDRLEDIYTTREQWSSVQEILLRRLENLEPLQRIPTFFQLAELAATHLSNLDEGLGYFHQILTVDPTNLQAVSKLEWHLREAGKWYELVEILRKHAEIAAADGDTEGEVAQLVAAARVWNIELENPEAAAELLEEILKRDESNVAALTGLAQIYETSEQWDRCQQILEQAAALNPDAQEAAELEFRMGRIELNKGGGAGQAAERYARAIELNPEHLEALQALEAHHRLGDEFDRVAELLELRVKLVDSGEQLKIYQELGSIYAEQLERPDDCVAALEAARELSPDSVEVLAPLADAYYLAARYDDAEPLLQKLMDQSVRGRRKDLARYTYRMGTIAEKRDDAAAARENYDKAYRLDSTFAPTLVALGRIHLHQEDWGSARRIYRSMLLQNIDRTAGITKADIFYNLGRAHAALGEKSKALSMFERGIEVDGSHEGLKQAYEEAKSS